MEQILYHYTGIDSLMSIVKHKTLWVSNIYYLNDSSGIIHARDILQKVITDLPKDYIKNLAQDYRIEFLIS